jgi:hypothetical protein
MSEKTASNGNRSSFNIRGAIECLVSEGGVIWPDCLAIKYRISSECIDGSDQWAGWRCFLWTMRAHESTETEHEVRQLTNFRAQFVDYSRCSDQVLGTIPSVTSRPPHLLGNRQTEKRDM